MRSVTWFPSLPRFGQSASNSSKKMRQGEFSLALRDLRAPLEQAPDGLLALAHVLVEQLGAFDRDEVAVRGVRDCLGEHRLAAARRPVEQDAGLHLDVEQLAALRVAQRANYRAGQLGLEVLQRADVFPLGLRHRREPVLLRQRHDLLAGLLEVLRLQKRGLATPATPRDRFECSLVTRGYLAHERVQVRGRVARRELDRGLETARGVLRAF